MITNFSKKGKEKIIVTRKKILTNIFSQGIGLMFHKKINDVGYVFVFHKERYVPITMAFVFFCIDILFLDKDKKVVEIIEKAKPFLNYWPKRKAQYVVELPKNTIKEKEIIVGDKLEF